MRTMKEQCLVAKTSSRPRISWAQTPWNAWNKRLSTLISWNVFLLPVDWHVSTFSGAFSAWETQNIRLCFHRLRDNLSSYTPVHSNVSAFSSSRAKIYNRKLSWSCTKNKESNQCFICVLKMWKALPKFITSEPPCSLYQAFLASLWCYSYHSPRAVRHLWKLCIVFEKIFLKCYGVKKLSESDFIIIAF